MTTFSFYNCLGFGHVNLVEYALMCLRKEKNVTVKKYLSSLVHNIIRVGISVAQLKGIMRICYKDYFDYYKNNIEKSISSQSLTKFVEGINDKDSFYNSLKDLYNKIILKTLQRYNNSLLR